MGETTRQAAARIASALHQCAWCGELKTKPEMRNPGSTRGKTPSTCYQCRSEHPGQAWCDYHGKPHSIAAFKLHGNGRPGHRNDCIAASCEQASIVRDHPLRHCVACQVEQTSWNFRGGRKKSATCRTCEESHPDRRWCLGCSAWLSLGLFTRTGKDAAYYATRCRPCRTADAHGTTVAAILALQDVSSPCCAACGATDALAIDHDHNCCPGARSCGRCVRGYLCHPCNTAEGLLKLPERARQLADYMERMATFEAARP